MESQPQNQAPQSESPEPMLAPQPPEPMLTPQPPVQTTVHHKSTKPLIAVIIILVIILIGVGLFFLFKKSPASTQQNESNTTPNTNQDNSKQDVSTDNATKTPAEAAKPTATTAIAANCPSSAGAKTFYNKIIGLEFCYPKEWGEATVGTVEASASTAGGAYEITFSSKDGLSIASATSDWQNTVARDGRCADPITGEGQKGSPQFATYQPDWKLEGSGMDVSSALRVHIKQEPNFLIRELASDYYNGVCLIGIVSTPGGAYTLQNVNLLRSFGGGITTVKAHSDTPNVLIPVSERTQFSELVASIKHAK